MFLPYVGRLAYFAYLVLCKNKTWVWDSVSVSCSQGWGTYILAIICSYTAIYFSSMNTLAYFSHYSTPLDTVGFVLNSFGYIILCFLGIFPTSFHGGLMSLVHIGAGMMFFIITIGTNVYCALYCNFLSSWPFTLSKILADVSVVLFLFLFVVQFVLNFLSYTITPENKECPINRANGICEKCSKRYICPSLNLVKYEYSKSNLVNYSSTM